MSKPVAVILGASTNPEKYGNKAVKAHLQQGYDVIPVNPGADEIEGVKAVNSITEIRGPVDRVSVYLPAAITADLIDDIAGLNPEEFWLNPGAESPELIEKAKEAGLNVVIACSIINLGVSPSDM